MKTALIICIIFIVAYILQLFLTLYFLSGIEKKVWGLKKSLFDILKDLQRVLLKWS